MKRALFEHKVLGVEDPWGSAPVAPVFPLLSSISPLIPPSLSSFSFLHSNLQWNQSGLQIALFSADLHVRESRVIGV